MKILFATWRRQSSRALRRISSSRAAPVPLARVHEFAYASPRLGYVTRAIKEAVRVSPGAIIGLGNVEHNHIVQRYLRHNVRELYQR